MKKKKTEGLEPFIEGELEKASTIVAVQDDRLYVCQYDLLVQGGLTPPNEDDNPGFNAFPVKIDSGYSGNFHISHKQLRSKCWADFDDEDIVPTGRQVETYYANGKKELLSLYYGDVWLHGSDGHRLCHIRIDAGFTAFGSASEGWKGGDGDLYKKVPLLGQRALHSIGARLDIDYDALKFTLHVPAKYIV